MKAFTVNMPLKCVHLFKIHSERLYVLLYLTICKLNIPSKKSSAQVGIWVISVLTRNGYIKCYISLFKEIILQQCDAFQTEILDSLTKPCAFKASRGHPSKMVKLPIMSPELKTQST